MDEEERPADEVVEEEEVNEEEAVQPEWGGVEQPDTGFVHIETGRGQTSEVPVGAPFQESIERVADETHYGGYFRVFLNGEELINPEEAPEKIEAGMRIALTSYDKVG